MPSEKSLSCTFVSEAFNGEIMVVASDINVVAYMKSENCCVSLERCGDTCVPFEIASMKIKEDLFLLTGSNEFILKKIKFSERVVTFETMAHIKRSQKIILTSILSSNYVFLLYENSIDIICIKDGGKRNVTFDSKLIDIGVIDRCDEVLFVLDEKGHIYFEDVNSIIGE